MAINDVNYDSKLNISVDALVQAFQRKAEIEQQNKRAAQQENDAAWTTIAQGASDAVSTTIERAKQRQKKDFINTLADSLASQTTAPAAAPTFTRSAPGEMGPRTQTTNVVPTASFDPQKADSIRAAVQLNPEAATKDYLENITNPYAQMQKQAQLISTQDTIAQKQRQLATSGPYNESLKAQGKELGIADAEMTGLQNKDLEERINQELRQKQIDALGKRSEVQEGSLELRKAQLRNEVAKSSDPTRAKPGEQIGVEFSRLKAAQRMITVAGTNQGKLTPQQLSTVGAEVANLAIAGGNNQRIAAEMIEKYVPNTFGSDLAAKIQWLKAKPQDAKAQEVLRPMLQEGLRIAQESEQNIRTTQINTINEAVDQGAITEAQGRLQKKRIGIDPDTDQPKKSVLPNFDPQDWYNRINGLKGNEATPDILDKSSSGGIPQVGSTFNGAKVLKVKRID